MRRYFAAFVAACALLVIVSGAVLTTLRHNAVQSAFVHTRIGIAFGILSFAVGIWALLDRHPVLRSLGLLTAVATGLEAMPRAVLVHACFAPVLFTAIACIAWFDPDDRKHAGAATPSLRWLVLALPPLVLLQIALGAAHRHEEASVMLHMGNALLVAGLILVVSVMLLRAFPAYQPLRSPAVTLIALVLLQVSLGIAVFLLRLLEMDSSLALIVGAAAHVTGGALILATCTALSLRYVRSVY